MNHPLNAMFFCSGEHIAGTIDIRCKDIFFGIERQSGGAMNDRIHIGHRLVERLGIAYIRFDDFDPFLDVRVNEIRDIERPKRNPPLQKGSDEIDSQKTGAAGNEYVLQWKTPLQMMPEGEDLHEDEGQGQSETAG